MKLIMQTRFEVKYSTTISVAVLSFVTALHASLQHIKYLT